MRHYMTDPDNEERLLKIPPSVVSDIKADAYQEVRELVTAIHRPLPVIECTCGWGVNCPECDASSSRVIGFVCAACCDDWGNHGYCHDMHLEDDAPFHHVDGEMWSGSYCPFVASIDELLLKWQP